MTDTSKHIRTGFYEDFKGYDTVLISVDIEGLCELENIFNQLSGGLLNYDFANLKYLDKNFSINIKTYNDKVNLGLIRVDKDQYEWRLTTHKWSIFRQRLTGLRLCCDNNGGHQYLDFETNHTDLEANNIDQDSLQVIFSLYEYPLSFWQEHFEKNN
jgi:hypothetical protein